MAIKLAKISNQIEVPISGTLPNGKGGREPFSFTLVCDRLTDTDLRQLQTERDEQSVSEFMASVTHDWKGVYAEGDEETPYSAEALSGLMNVVGMAGVVLGAYVQACGARGKEKN